MEQNNYNYQNGNDPREPLPVYNNQAPYGYAEQQQPQYGYAEQQPPQYGYADQQQYGYANQQPQYGYADPQQQQYYAETQPLPMYSNGYGAQSADDIPEIAKCSGSAFGMGLTSLILLCTIGWLPIFSLLPLIFGSVAVKKAKNAEALGLRYGVTVSGKKTAGKVMGRISKIIGLIGTIFWALYIVLVVILVVVAGTSAGFYI